MRRKTRRRTTRRKGGNWNQDFAKIVANAKKRSEELPTFEAFQAKIAKKKTDKERKKFLKSGRPLPPPFYGGRRYPKSRTHIYTRATPTHSIYKKRSKSRRKHSKGRSKSRSRSRSKSRRKRRRKRGRRSN